MKILEILGANDIKNFKENRVAISGAETLMFDVIKELVQYDVNVSVILDPWSSLKDKFEYIDVSIYYLSSKRLLDINLIKDLIKLVLKEKVDLIHSHGYRQDFYATIVSSFTGVPFVITRHLPIEKRKWKGIKKNIVKKVDHISLIRARKIICVSREIEKKLKKELYLQSKVLYIPNGIDVNRFKPKRSYELKGDVPVITTIARLEERKGFHWLFEALSLLKRKMNFKFQWVGHGKDFDKAKYTVNSLKLDNNVEFLGIRRDIVQILQNTDIFLLPSLAEGLPISLLEAMACGVPSITTNVGEIPSVVKHGVTGYLVEVGDKQTLVELILYLVKNKTKRKEIGIQAREFVSKNYSIIKTAKSYLNVYKDVLSK
ncbi:MAG TPA: glycosyltransferase family 1 protein [Candidatus Atribacteria bacterium]|nr:glycosyltransferase family 1 protein [Candidatus Atribacteria bacterium]